MFTRCLTCYTPFATNDVLQDMPHARRVAFDAQRGRLWAVCDACARWTLAPIESRWETLEELSSLITSPRARLLKSGENISLVHADGLDIVHVGRAGLREESWWRYGHELHAREERARKVVRRGKVIDGILMLAIAGIPYWGHSNPNTWLNRARRRSFGRTAWRGESQCETCGRVLSSLEFKNLDRVRLIDDTEALHLRYLCTRCDPQDQTTGHRFSSVTSEHMLRRVLAWQNFAGAGDDGINSAISLLGHYPEPAALIRDMSQQHVGITSLKVRASLALEIALNTDVEARQLANEVAALEERWREEEELASIIDRELS